MNKLIKSKILTSTYYKDDSSRKIREFYFNVSPDKCNVISALSLDSYGFAQENIVANLDKSGKISLISSSFLIIDTPLTEHKIIIFYI